MNVFCEQLKQLRKAAGLNQSELGEKLNCQRTRIADLERGKSTPTIEDITILCNTFKVSSDYLLGLSHVATTDTELKAVCEYTGLTEKAAQKLYDSETLRLRFPEPDSNITYLDTINWILTDATVAEAIMNVFWYRGNLRYLLQDQKELLNYLESTDFDAIKFSDKYTELQHSYKDVRFYLFEALEKFRTAISKDSETILNDYIQNDKLLHEKNEYYTIQFFKNKYESSDS